jgi:hypothetical protein
MSFFNGSGLVAAMEDETTQDTELAIDAAGAESMEADLVEAVDLAADIDSGSREIESTMKDADQLERHVEVLGATEGEGGASEEVVQATEIAVESIYARLGIHSGTGIPALESFSTKHGKAKSTREAMEAIGENIKKIWEAVKMAFQKLVNYVKDFFGKLFDANQKMLGRVNSLRAKVREAKGTSSGKVKASGIKGVIAGDALKDARKGAGVGQIAAAAKTLSGDANDIQAAIKGVESDGSFKAFTFSPSGKGAAKAQAPDGMQWTALYNVGTATVASLEPKGAKKGEEAYKAAAKSSVKVLKAEAKGADGDLAALDVAGMNSVLDGVEAAVKELIGQKATIAAAQGSLEKAVAEINKLASGGDKEDKELGNRSTVARSAVTAMGNAAIKGLTLMGSETARVCQAYLTYVERSVGTFSEAKDKGGKGKDDEGSKE